MSRVLANRRRTVTAGRVLTVAFAWAPQAGGIANGGPAVRVRYRANGATRTIVLQRRLVAPALVSAAQR
jgi:hypothetical protein